MTNKMSIIEMTCNFGNDGYLQKELHDAFVDCSFDKWCDFG